MTILKIGALVATVLALAGTAPAYAHKDGVDWISMMQRDQAARSRAQQRPTPKAAPVRELGKPGWKFIGGPKGGAVWTR